MGEIEAARFAGIMAAKNEQIASVPAATVSASGSHEETPYSWAESNRPAPTARGNPRIRPTNTRLNAPPSTSRITFGRSAPSAMRMPISLVLCATVYAVTPYNPTAASTSATIPNKPARLATAGREFCMGYEGQDGEQGGILGDGQPKVLGQRIFVALEKALHERLVHDRYGRRGFVVRCRKRPSAQNRHAPVLQIVCAYPVPRCARFFVKLGWRMTRHHNQFAPVVGQRDIHRQPGSLNAWQATELLFQLAIQRRQLRLRVARSWRVHIHHHAPLHPISVGQMLER